MNTLATGIRAIAVAALAALPLLAAAQSDYPNRPVKVLVPYAPAARPTSSPATSPRG